MDEIPLGSLAGYSSFVANLLDRPSVQRSTVVVWSDSPFTGIAEGEVWFINGFRLRLRQELDFHAALITSYGYEVYHNDERFFWYDDFPHPQDSTLASLFLTTNMYRPISNAIEFRHRLSAFRTLTCLCLFVKLKD